VQGETHVDVCVCVAVADAVRVEEDLRCRANIFREGERKKPWYSVRRHTLTFESAFASKSTRLWKMQMQIEWKYRSE
jgi:hypothetical protein